MHLVKVTDDLLTFSTRDSAKSFACSLQPLLAEGAFCRSNLRASPSSPEII